MTVTRCVTILMTVTSDLNTGYNLNDGCKVILMTFTR